MWVWAAADPDIFAGRVCFLCPSARTSDEAAGPRPCSGKALAARWCLSIRRCTTV